MGVVGGTGAAPLAVGTLPTAILGTLTPHVANQERLVDAALMGDRALALEALVNDPLVRDPSVAPALLDEMLAANAAYLYVLPFETLKASPLVASDTMVRVLGATGAALVAVMVMLSTLGAICGLGLAVPINTATRRVVAALLSDGRVRRGYLGIAGAPRPVPGHDAGVEVLEVVPGSPADTGGLRPGDVLVELDGRRVTGVQDVQRLMEDEVIGTRVVVTALRDGRERQMTVVPRELGG